MGKQPIAISLTVILALLGCGEDVSTSTSGSPQRVSGCCCGHEIQVLSKEVQDSLESLEADLFAAISGIETGQTPDAGGADVSKRLLAEIYTDLSWLRYIAGDSEGANDAARLAIKHGHVDLLLLQTLRHQTTDMHDALIAAAQQHLDPKRGARPAGLWSDDFRSISDADAERMYQWCQTAGLYAYLGDQEAVKMWTAAFTAKYRVSKFYKGVSELAIAEGYLLAGELDKGLAVLKKRDAELTRPPERAQLESETDDNQPPPKPHTKKASAEWSPPLLTALGVQYARALRCAGKKKQAREAMESMRDLRALNASDLLDLAHEWGHHGEAAYQEQAILRYLDEQELLVLQAGDTRAFERFFRDSFLILSSRGFDEEAQATVQQFMLLPEDPERPQDRAAQQMLLGMTYFSLGEVERADEAFEQMLLMQERLRLPELEPPPYAITQSALRLRDRIGPNAFDPIILSHEVRETGADTRLAAVRGAVVLSGVTIDASTIQQWTDLPDDVRCGLLLGQMHLALENKGKSPGRAVGRKLHDD